MLGQHRSRVKRLPADARWLPGVLRVAVTVLFVISETQRALCRDGNRTELEPSRTRGHRDPELKNKPIV